MSKARELAELGAVYDSGALSNRNMVINGAMQLSQRATSEASLSTFDKYPCVDRFKLQGLSSGTFTISQSTTSPDGFGNSLKIDCTTADSSPNYLMIMQRMEGQNLQQLKKGTSSAEKVTVSFYVRSTKTGTYQFNIRDNGNNRLIGKTYTIDAADTWERKSLTFDGDTSGTLANDTTDQLRLEWWLAAGSTYNSGSVPTAWETLANGDRAAGLNVAIGASTSDDFHLTGVQMELGTEATPFEHRSFGDELHRCQRYFEVIVSGDSKEIGGGNYYSSSAIHCPVIFETTKRTNSYSVTVTGGSNYFRVYRNSSSDDFNGFTGATRANFNRCLLYAQSGVSGSAGHGLELLTNNASAKIVIDDEL